MKKMENKKHIDGDVVEKYKFDEYYWKCIKIYLFI